jgi:hypothetical protein
MTTKLLAWTRDDASGEELKLARGANAKNGIPAFTNMRQICGALDLAGDHPVKHVAAKNVNRQ